MGAGRKARLYQRSRHEITIIDGKPHSAGVSRIEVRMGSEKGIRFLFGRFPEAIDIMVAVALHVGHPNQGAQSKVLLHGYSGLAVDVFAGNEELVALLAPLRGAGRIEDRFVDSFARFGGYAAVAERACRRKRAIGVVGFIDDEVECRERAKRYGAGDIARHWLLDIEKPACNRLKRGIVAKEIHEILQRREIRILLVGIKRHASVVGKLCERFSDADQACGIGVRIAGKLELEIARAGVLLDVAKAGLALDGIVEADRMPDRDSIEPAPPGKKLRNVLISKIAR